MAPNSGPDLSEMPDRQKTLHWKEQRPAGWDRIVPLMEVEGWDPPGGNGSQPAPNPNSPAKGHRRTRIGTAPADMTRRQKT